ncbi:hypothetical protein FB446DRAFT_338580 [Lentinula raphanica]|nr:hypothetical protein FB446DRAFT_338580 [Lentinula raphanica]
MASDSDSDSGEYHGLQILTTCIELIGVSLLSFCLARRVPTGWRQWRHLTWGRTCVLLVLLDSWIFVFFCEVTACSLRGVF